MPSPESVFPVVPQLAPGETRWGPPIQAPAVCSGHRASLVFSTPSSLCQRPSHIRALFLLPPGHVPARVPTVLLGLQIRSNPSPPGGLPASSGPVFPALRPPGSPERCHGSALNAAGGKGATLQIPAPGEAHGGREERGGWRGPQRGPPGGTPRVRTRWPRRPVRPAGSLPQVDDGPGSGHSRSTGDKGRKAQWE